MQSGGLPAVSLHLMTSPVNVAQAVADLNFTHHVTILLILSIIIVGVSLMAHVSIFILESLQTRFGPAMGWNKELGLPGARTLSGVKYKKYDMTT